MSPLSRRRGHSRGQPQPGPGQVLLLPAQQVRQREDGVREMPGEPVERFMFSQQYSVPAALPHIDSY